MEKISIKYSLFVLLCSVVSCFAKAQTKTYKDIAPIILSKCAGCHRPGDAAPFSLLTYEDVSKRSSFIRELIEKKIMPPWRADDQYCSFANNRQLSAADRSSLVEWIKAGAPKGKINSTDKPPDLITETVYKRKPDLTFKIDSPFLAKGDNKERFVVFKIPFEFDSAYNIEALEFFTNNKKIIHHINYGFYAADKSIDIYGGMKMLNATDGPLPPSDPFAVYIKQMVYYTGWIPGTSYENYPEDFGWVLPKRGVLLLTTHYSAIAADEKSVVGVNIFFSKKAIKRPVQIISLGSGGIGEEQITPPLVIMPNQLSKFELKVKSNTDRSFLYVWPHMHYLGKEFTAYAVTPNADTIKLVHIPNWDFRWQELYKFQHLIKIPAGSAIHIECLYDNTTANPNNPNNPPKAILSSGNMDSKNEMMTLLLIFTPYQAGDEEISLK